MGRTLFARYGGTRSIAVCHTMRDSDCVAMSLCAACCESRPKFHHAGPLTVDGGGRWRRHDRRAFSPAASTTASRKRGAQQQRAGALPADSQLASHGSTARQVCRALLGGVKNRVDRARRATQSIHFTGGSCEWIARIEARGRRDCGLSAIPTFFQHQVIAARDAQTQDGPTGLVLRVCHGVGCGTGRGGVDVLEFAAGVRNDVGGVRRREGKVRLCDACPA